jgi:CO/xanthine dehydrogenase FAD-binding subunit
MPVVAPTSLEGALAALREHPDAQLLAGGTDFMVEVNAGHRRPSSVIALRNVRELRERVRTGTTLRIGAMATHTELCAADVAAAHPALAAAARTVGSPQIRNAGTLGGNVGTASPAGDTLPVLAALDARIELRSADGDVRTLAWNEFFTGPKRTARRPDELITAIEVPVLDALQDYLKVGTRNAMVISVAGLALVVDCGGRNVRCALGSVGPVPLRAPEAEAWIAERIDWDARTLHDRSDAAAFAELVAAAARPIDDHRATAAYRRHAIRTLAERALLRLLAPSTNGDRA